MKNKQKANWQKRSSRPPPPTLRFTPTAWAKLLFMRDYGDIEVGGFGIALNEDLMLVVDFQLVKQFCTSISVAFDDQSVAEFFDQQVDRGLHPGQFARLWVHTHPGNCPLPSRTDEKTFAEAFGSTDWAVMFILAQGGQTYARLQYHVGPGAALELEVEIDFGKPFEASDAATWEAEYLANVHEGVRQVNAPTPVPPDAAEDFWNRRVQHAPALALGGGDDGHTWHGAEDLRYDDDYEWE